MLALDHIVVSVKDAEKTSEEKSGSLSIKAIKGGNHEEWGTFNYLAHFANDSYLEWLSINDKTKAQESDNPLIQHLLYIQEKVEEPFPFQFALRTDDLDGYIEHFKAKQIPFKGPIHGERTKPDGTTLKWRMLFPEYNIETEMLPFLIQWDTPNKVPGLDNPQAITSIKYGDLSKEKFAHIYQLNHVKSKKNYLRLQNTKLYFTKDKPFSYKLT